MTGGVAEVLSEQLKDSETRGWFRIRAFQGRGSTRAKSRD